jgi:cysteine synthase
MKIYDNICELIGNTPIVRLKKMEKQIGVENELFAKLEKMNPGGSSKDRVAYQIIKNGIETGIIDYKTTIIEATSGNTGIGLAMVCAYYDLPLIVVMSESVTIERVKLLEAYGAKIVLTPNEEGIEGAIAEAKRLNAIIENSYYVNQFQNENNPLSHYLHTGEEIFESFGNELDYVFVGMGSSGTISGIARRLKEKNKKVKIIGIEPADCPYYSKREKGNCRIPGIGTTFMPKIAQLDLIDDYVTVDDKESVDMMRLIAKTEGILVGISSGAVMVGAREYIKQKQINDKKVLLIFPDTGERYLSIIKK